MEMHGEYISALRDCANEIKTIEKRINQNQLDSIVRFLTQYAIIRSSGVIENTLKKMVYDYLSNDTTDDTKNYLTKSILESSTNPRTGNMLKYLEFNSDKRKNFESKLKEFSKQKEELNSLVQLRNDFAHGINTNRGILTIKSYYKSGAKILECFNYVLFDEEEDYSFSDSLFISTNSQEYIESDVDKPKNLAKSATVE